MFLKRWLSWFKKGVKEEQVVIKEDDWPEEIWARMFAMARYAEKLQLGPLGVHHFDREINVTTTSTRQLFRYIEILISSIDEQADTPDWWKDRNREKEKLTLVQFYWDRRTGYQDPQAILKILIEKVMMIHYQLESQSIKNGHNYYHYMLREFFQVVSDVVEVLTASIDMANSQQHSS